MKVPFTDRDSTEGQYTYPGKSGDTFAGVRPHRRSLWRWLLAILRNPGSEREDK